MEEGQILARDDEYDEKGNFLCMGQKGPRLEVEKPGRHMINPKYLKVTVKPATTIEKGKIGVKIRKYGKQPPHRTVLVDKDSEYRGIQKGILHPGTYYLNPLAVDIEVHDAIVIEKGSVGIVNKKVGTLPPTGTVLVNADDEYKGIQKEVLHPGMYYFNPYEKTVKIVDAVVVLDGHVGVQIAKTGKPKPVEQLLAKPGEQGILEEILSPGLYYINPYEYDVVVFDVKQQRYEMTQTPDQGDTKIADAIHFLSDDGFDITFDLTIISQVFPKDAPYIVATVGRDVKTITEKIIRPAARSFARIIGSKKKGEEFIHGEMREEFQKNLHEKLKTKCVESKIQIRQTLVRRFEVPGNLREPITQKVIALKLQEKYVQEQKTEEANAQLARQKELVIFESEKIKSETEKAKKLIVAEMKKQESLIEYQRKLETAQLEKQEAEVRKETADIDAKRIMTLADAEAYKKERILQADNALEQKLNAAVEINKVWADAFAKRRVPTNVFGGTQSGEINNDAQIFQQMVNALIAKQLAVDLSIEKKINE